MRCKNNKLNVYRKGNIIPWNLFLSLTSAALHFWAITGPQDYLDKAPPYMPAYKMQFKDISKAYLGSKENMLKHAEVSLKSLFLPKSCKIQEQSTGQRYKSMGRD